MKLIPIIQLVAEQRLGKAAKRALLHPLINLGWVYQGEYMRAQE